MIYWLYAQLLKRQITDLPAQVCFMISGQDLADAPDSLYTVTSWCNAISSYVSRRQSLPSSGIRGLMFHIATPSPEDLEQYLPAIRKISTIARLNLHVGDRKEVSGKGMDVVVAIGKSGREEITACIRKMARDHVDPESVDEKMIESCLTFQYTPDVVIKSGGDHLTDFLIWQAVYSELFFSDVNWKLFRKVDFLRVLRDYQSRIRRFGK
ncbi:MAG: undecaprenyl diphosphate synthase family protein [Methanoregula sp.]|nr:undecaprenyl diphosphate synthase family protein [Methanoregula sp.]